MARLKLGKPLATKKPQRVPAFKPVVPNPRSGYPAVGRSDAAALRRAGLVPRSKTPQVIPAGRWKNVNQPVPPAYRAAVEAAFKKAPAAPGTPDAGTGTPAASTDPYAAYAAYPWAHDYLTWLDQNEQTHKDWITKQVMPWTSGVTTALQNYSGTQMQNYGNYVAGITGALGQQIGSATTPQVAGAAGGVVADPNAFLTRAAGQQGLDSAKTTSALAATTAASQNLVNTSQMLGITNWLTRYATTDLPYQYAQKRQDARMKIDQAINDIEATKAKLAQDQAQFDTTEQNKLTANAQDAYASIMRSVISAASGMALTPYQIASLRIAAQNAANGATSGTGTDTPGGLAGPSSGPAPAGKVWVQRSDGGWQLVDDGTTPSPSSTPAAPTTGPAAKGSQDWWIAKGFQVWSGRGKPKYPRAVQASDTHAWLIPKPGRTATSGTSGTTTGPSDDNALASKLAKLYFGNSTTGGWSQLTVSGGSEIDDERITRLVAQWGLNLFKQIKPANWAKLSQQQRGAVWDRVFQIIDLGTNNANFQQRVAAHWRRQRLGPYA